MRKQCFGMLHVLENEISLWKRSGGAANLRILEGTMISSIWILAEFTHFHVSFASFENWVISVTIKDIPRNSSNCFRRKNSPDYTAKLAIISSINLISVIIFDFIFLQKSQKRKRPPWMSCLKFSTFSEKHEVNKNKYGLTKESFSTRMTKTTHACSAI